MVAHPVEDRNQAQCEGRNVPNVAHNLTIGVWRSLVARFVRDEEVVGSNPATPTQEIAGQRASRRTLREALLPDA